MNDFIGKTVLITGGTSGIGKACALRFAKEGANVIIAGRNKEKGIAIIEEMNIVQTPCARGGGIAISI